MTNKKFSFLTFTVIVVLAILITIIMSSFAKSWGQSGEITIGSILDKYSYSIGVTIVCPSEIRGKKIVFGSSKSILESEESMLRVIQSSLSVQEYSLNITKNPKVMIVEKNISYSDSIYSSGIMKNNEIKVYHSDCVNFLVLYKVINDIWVRDYYNQRFNAFISGVALPSYYISISSESYSSSVIVNAPLSIHKSISSFLYVMESGHRKKSNNMIKIIRVKYCDSNLSNIITNVFGMYGFGSCSWDYRTNSLIAVGSSELIAQIELLVEIIDVKTLNSQNSYWIRLRNRDISVADVLIKVLK